MSSAGMQDDEDDTGAAAPAADTGMDDTTEDSGDASDDAGADEAGASGATVLCTIMDNGDGTYTLIAGDEPEGDTSMGADASAGADDEGADDSTDAGVAQAGMAPAEGGSPSPAAGKTYSTPGALLKGVLDLVKQAEEANPSSEDSGFDEGFTGKAKAKPDMAQKHS